MGYMGYYENIPNAMFYLLHGEYKLASLESSDGSCDEVFSWDPGQRSFCGRTLSRAVAFRAELDYGVMSSRTKYWLALIYHKP